jgi:hypothetical protein
MTRTILGWLLILHALAHAAVGVWIAADTPPALLTLAWMIALVGFLAVGLGLLRAPFVRDRWKALLFGATIASSILCIAFGGLFGLAGFAIDMILFVVAADVIQRRIDAAVTAADLAGARVSLHPLL